MTDMHLAPPRPDVDLLDPTFHVGDPHPTYRWMREHEPVYRDRNGICCVTRMDDLRDVERRSGTFVSSQGYRSVWVPTETSMISKDDPAHTAQRRLVADRFEVVDTIAARLPALLTCRLLGWDDAHWRDR